MTKPNIEIKKDNSSIKYVTVKWAIGDGIVEQNKVLVCSPKNLDSIAYARNFAYDMIGEFVSGEFPVIVKSDFDLDFSMFAWAIFNKWEDDAPIVASWNWK